MGGNVRCLQVWGVNLIPFAFSWFTSYFCVLLKNKKNMKIIRNRFIPVKGFKAINLFGILFVRGNSVISNRILTHERIHTMQMREMLYLPFYLWYGIEYVIKFIGRKFGKKNPFYPNYRTYDLIGFEREAYDNEHDVDYPKTRKHYSWFKYI